MAIHQTESSLDAQVLRVLGQYKEIALEKFEKHFGDVSPPLSEERMLAFWEHLDGRRGWDGIPQVEEWYGALLLGPILQLQRWIESPAPSFVPSFMVLGRLVQIGLLIADATAQLDVREKSKQDGEVRFEDVERQVLSDIAKRAVAHRPDQQLKPNWIAHCERLVKEGRSIDRLSDLLDVAGYDPALTKIQSATLRRWASEVGVRFKAGRPKK